MKLYLNSFHQTKFNSKIQVLETIKKDISFASGSTVDINFFSIEKSQKLNINQSFFCLDKLDINILQYDYSEDFLQNSTSNKEVTEKLCSHLFKSNCLITNQPDFASVYIIYTGRKINHETLLKYIISFRNHNEFHEQCVERIYSDIKRCCRSKQLTVFSRYTRRGGLDINPFRSDSCNHTLVSRMPRQ
ncbi:NADPH-dependent 7-cyano-7-deazaguanine reductase (plasmid) [Candidatus Photodesmus blepharus]|uniref:NADPH-dependent 7-cyano-7-deazaguanine reductase n=2 Tax=Candidatus Photodesmus blepharonis TaxID=1179155 RepID=A0A084CNW2_9GAMM|nr:NADPH-dependent 7-cyano-7-deazaguanine reductase [Candidatus Photodesmus blepharus]